MKTGSQLATKFRELIWTKDWVSTTSFKTQLSDVTWEQANQKIESLNTIAMLTFHVHYYIKGLVDFFESGKLTIQDKYSFSMSPIESPEDWQKLLDDFWSDAEKFAAKVEQMSQQQLGEVFVDEKYGNYHRNIEAMNEHCFYHLGQIVLLKKLMGSR